MGRHTNNISELYAIGLAIHIIQHHPHSKKWINSMKDKRSSGSKQIIRILSDSQYSIGVLSKNWKAKKNQELVGWIKRDLSNLCQNGNIVLFHWVGGHADIKYNEMADNLANQGVDAVLKNKQSVDIKKPPNIWNNGVSKIKEKGKQKEKIKDKKVEDDSDSDSDDDGLVIENLRVSDNNSNSNRNNPLKRGNKKRKFSSVQEIDVMDQDKNKNKNEKEDNNPSKRRRIVNNTVIIDSDTDVEILNKSNDIKNKVDENKAIEKQKEKENSNENREMSQVSMCSSPPQSPIIL